MATANSAAPGPDEGYAGADFDRYYRDAAGSRQLGELFGEYFDPSAPPEVRGFCFVPMAGLSRVAELLAESAAGPLLDAACGRGGPGIWLSRRTGRRAHGVDISRVAVEQARELATRLGSDATFTTGSLDDTGLDDEAFAATVCLDALHFAADPAVAAAELRRARPSPPPSVRASGC
jgi:SAM-dependent methyltransferase